VTLRRACLNCSRMVRGASRCTSCQAKRERAKRARRPDLHNDRAERRRRAQAVATHRATVGDWCPGVPELDRGAHPAANLTADHVIEVAAGGLESGPLVVRCGPCNSARSANVGRVLTSLLVTTPLPAERPITHLDGDDPGPVAA
jgi:hypothetical protein